MRNYGKLSLITSLVSWFIMIIFTVAAWEALDRAYEGHKAGMPRPEGIWMDIIFPYIAFLSYPISALAVIFAIFSIYRQRNYITAIIGGLIGGALFLFLSFGLLFGAGV
jgi:uncharacterized membrane protein YkvI